MYSTSTKYALLALIELAARRTSGHLTGKDLSKATGTPRDFLTKVMQTLVRAGLLRAKRGRRGGYEFDRPPSQITIAQVARAVEGPQVFDKCIFSLQPCSGVKRCPHHHRWNPVRAQIMTFVKSTNIAALALDIRAADTRSSVEERGGATRVLMNPEVKPVSDLRNRRGHPVDKI